MPFLKFSNLSKSILNTITSAQTKSPNANATLRWISARGGVMKSSIIFPNLNELIVTPKANPNSCPINQLFKATSLHRSPVSLPTPRRNRPIIANVKDVVYCPMKKLETIIINWPIVSTIENIMNHELRPMVSINHPPNNGNIMLPYEGTAYSKSNLGVPLSVSFSLVISSFICCCAFLTMSYQ